MSIFAPSALAGKCVFLLRWFSTKRTNYSRSWYPEGLVLTKGKQDKPIKSHNLSDKTIADVCEALIGAALLTHYKTRNFDNAVRAVTELVCSEDHAVTHYEDYYKLYKMPKYQTLVPTASQRDLAMQIEQKHPYHFKYPSILRSAFTHPSYPYSYEQIPSYQRLEFLGDSLLDLACIEFLFHRFPTSDPQWLTEHKMAMVSNQFFGALCVSLGFHRHMLSFSSLIQKQIKDYVTEIDEARLEAEEAAVSAGKDKSEWSRDFWAYTKQPPKCLPDLIESYVGAIFVDSEYNYAEVERFFQLHIQPYFEDMSIHDQYANRHPINLLNKLLTISMGCSNWGVYAEQRPDIGDGMPPEICAAVVVHDRVVADHRGVNRKEAKAAAAQKACQNLQGMPPPEFRVEYGCDCNLTMDEKAEKGESCGAEGDYVKF
jgi:endoribonuclease Dicer